MKLFKDDGFGVDVQYNGYARGGVKPRKRTKANLQAAVNELGREVLELRSLRDKLLTECSAKGRAIEELNTKMLVALPGEPGMWTFINQRGKRVTIAAARDPNGQLQVNVVEPA